MSRIKKAFEGKAFIGFVTGGDPSIEKTVEFVLEMEKGGADLVEIGVPFSDPVAEGPVIQKANQRALSAGTTLPRLFEAVEEVRKVTQIPLVFLTYLNPVFRFGYPAFFKKCQASGVDGVIIPDMPYEEQGEAKFDARENGVDLISLIAPTSKDRVQRIAKDADGFIYVVSSMGVTGTRREIASGYKDIIASARQVTSVPLAVGFGVSEPAQAKEIAKTADGVIVGSAITKLVEKHGADAGPHIQAYTKSMKDAVISG
ncbi:MAG: tryptophan synthase subunit alpha [Clostridiales bacterium]|jgi:tryptophan synthase alpha chain|nr:tryptophan synthase subunit alpha [Clostridiales bacterium]